MPHQNQTPPHTLSLAAMPNPHPQAQEHSDTGIHQRHPFPHSASSPQIPVASIPTPTPTPTTPQTLVATPTIDMTPPRRHQRRRHSSRRVSVSASATPAEVLGRGLGLGFGVNAWGIEGAGDEAGEAGGVAEAGVEFASVCDDFYVSHCCDTWYKVIGALSVLGRAAVLTTFTMRAYAVWSGNRILLAYLVLIGLTCIALDITHVPGLRCEGSSSIPMYVAFHAILSSPRIDGMFHQCFQAFRVHHGFREIRDGGLMGLVLEQGVLYFCVVSLFTVTAIILNYRAPTGFLQSLLNAITLPLSGLLTARFLLHIRQWDYEHHTMNSKSSGDGSNCTDFDTDPGMLSTFAANTIEEFGFDPVARAHADDRTFVDPESGFETFDEREARRMLIFEHVPNRYYDDEPGLLCLLRTCIEPAALGSTDSGHQICWRAIHLSSNT
ncbi:hypothetical protein EIP91_008000 [Steccherinum ochraceum]|uniref:Uncharacterized protein n=1 Tax=Steccherinum ochraceum TaxID=92696 RepID=A0A4R0R659_9APHY|nr:hypothetical protein EIP91_008000 [Steccherinum ochraceum]